METSDPSLPIVRAMLAGDQSALERFVRLHSRWVRGVIFGVMGDTERVDDVSQHVWVTVWQQIGTLQEPQSWRTWLYRLARNAALDAGRKLTRRRKLNRSLVEQMELAGNSAVNNGSAVDEEQREVVMQAVNALPALYREPFVLRHLEDWSYRQIAEVLDMPVDTVETRLVRARRHLREALKDKVQGTGKWA